jgi:hypothetical protein
MFNFMRVNTLIFCLIFKHYNHKFFGRKLEVVGKIDEIGITTISIIQGFISLKLQTLFVLQQRFL